MSLLRLIATLNCFLHPVGAHIYAVHGCMVGALDSFTHTTWLRFWGSGLLVDSK